MKRSAFKYSFRFLWIVVSVILLSPNAWAADMGAIVPAATYTGEILIPHNAQDSFTFEGNRGDYVVITAARISGNVQPQIFLIPQGGGIEASAEGIGYHKTLNHELQAAGNYTILINEYGMDADGEYGLALVQIPGAATSAIDTNGGEIASGVTVSGSLAPQGDTDVYQFYGEAGDYVVITAARISGSVEPQISLYPPDNSGREAFVGGIGYNKTLNHPLEQSGLYTIVLSEYGMNAEGDYGLALVKIPGPPTSPGDPDGGPIASGETKTGSLMPLADTDIYQFYGEAGDYVVITAAMMSGSVEPQISLYPPDNSGREAFKGGIGYNKTLNHPLEQSGLYTIVLSEFGMNAEGDYGLALVRLPGARTSPGDPDGGPLASGETKTGSLMPVSDTDIYQFYGEAGDYVVISAARISGSVEPQISLYPPDNSGREAFAGGIGYNKTLNHSLERSGLYTIVLSEYGMDANGNYSVSLTKIPSDSAGIHSPFPAEKSSVDLTCHSFSWNSIPEATGYDLYFGEDVITPLEKIGDNLPSPSMPLPELDRYTVYYWQVVAHTPSGDINSPVWWFETNGHYGDFDSDGDVDGTDLNVLSDAMLTFDPAVDVDGDGEIDAGEMVLFLCNFGRSD